MKVSLAVVPDREVHVLLNHIPNCRKSAHQY